MSHESEGRMPDTGGALGWVRSLDRDTKALLSLAGFIGVAFASARGCGAIVDAKALEDHAREERIEREKLEARSELAFEAQIRTIAKVEHVEKDVDVLGREVAGVRKDLRDMDAGRSLRPLVHTSARHPVVP